MRKIIIFYLMATIGGYLMAENLYVPDKSVILKKNNWVVCTVEIVPDTKFQMFVLSSNPSKFYGKYLYNLHTFETFDEARQFLGDGEGNIFQIKKLFLNKNVYKEIESKQIEKVFSHSELDEIK